MKAAYNYYVYILECPDHSYYVGVCNDIERRIAEHTEGVNKNSYTFSRRPVKLKLFELYTEISQAIAREKQLKGWSKKKKEALMHGDFEQLRGLSKSSGTLRQAQGDNAIDKQS
ncbi:MAG: hypothetical protein C4308_12750 [Chitinophagaceae bacterium]